MLLYDGDCGLCAASVQFVLRHERARTLKFAPLQGRFAEAVRARHPALESLDSMVWVEPSGDGEERLFVRSDAALKAAAYLGGAWRAAAIVRLVPRALRDSVYNWIARHRHTAFAPPSCLVPSRGQRQRFIE